MWAIRDERGQKFRVFPIYHIYFRSLCDLLHSFLRKRLGESDGAKISLNFRSVRSKRFLFQSDFCNFRLFFAIFGNFMNFGPHLALMFLNILTFVAPNSYYTGFL